MKACASTALRPRRTLRRADLLRVAGGTTVALATAVVLATPASAQAAGQTSAFGLSCTGAVLTCPPTPTSSFPGASPVSVATAAFPPGSPVVTATALKATSAKTGATADVATLTLTPAATAPAVTANAIDSTCTVDQTTGKVSGSAAIASGSITNVPPGGTTPLSANPPPNTLLQLPGPIASLGSVILNRQTFDSAGALTVDAIYISLAPGTPAAQTITIASTTCTPAVIAAAPAPTVAPAPPAARAPAPAAAAPQVLAPVGGVNTGGGPPPASFLDSPLLGVLGGLLLSAGAALGLVTYRRRLAGEK